METISTYTSRLVPGDVVLHRGAPARVIRVGETRTPGSWSVTVDCRGNDLPQSDAIVVRDFDAVWEVVTAHTVHRGDVVRVGSGRVEWKVRGFELDGRARLAAANGRKMHVDVDRLVVTQRAESIDNEVRAIDHLVPEVPADEEPASQADVKRVREQVAIVVELRAAAQHAFTNAAMTSSRERADMYREQADLFNRAADVIVRAS